MNRDKHSEWLHISEYYRRAEFSQTAVKAHTLLYKTKCQNRFKPWPNRLYLTNFCAILKCFRFQIGLKRLIKLGPQCSYRIQKSTEEKIPSQYLYVWNHPKRNGMDFPQCQTNSGCDVNKTWVLFWKCCICTWRYIDSIQVFFLFIIFKPFNMYIYVDLHFFWSLCNIYFTVFRRILNRPAGVSSPASSTSEFLEVAYSRVTR